MSATKLAEIDDPELCLLRSVLINNTIKKLNADIRNEKEARLRLKQQKMDLFAERYAIASNSVDNTEHLSSSSNFNSSSNEVGKPNSTANTSDFYDESSCDEIFGLTEDFLRVPTPDRRVSSPIPTTNSHSSRNTDNQQQHQESMDTSEPLSDITTSNVTCYSSSNSFLPSCNTDIDCSSSFYQRRTTQNNNSSSNKQTVNNITAFPSAVPSSSSLKQFLVSVSSASNGGSQCATQYRTNRDVVGGSGSGESFPPRVPILDEVVYHSLLASMNT
ncbi:SERTA domain-containing protein [Caerostris extrusa]|uniref:SERTA domain-containing protein n=1 Tax=Caerostris extrusa TaxID=172846 RepID=A0AAV4NHC8_CAEEX|nr:SERTA domain-containing protein [Caerostris extrusa]